MFVMGDINSCTLDTALPSFHQYVHVPTRNNKTIYLCYGNIPSTYSARAQPPLGRADQNVINLIPAYRQLLKRVKPTKVKVRQWTQDATMQLQGSLACSDWGVFPPDSVNLNEHASFIMDYVSFCVYHSNANCDCLSQFKALEHVWYKKNTLKKKQVAYRTKDIHTIKNAHRQLQTEISQAKQRYLEKTMQ